MLLVVRCLTNNDLPSGAVFGTVIIARALIQGSLLSRPYLFLCIVHIVCRHLWYCTSHKY